LRKKHRRELANEIYICNWASRVLFRSKRWKLPPLNNSHGRRGLSCTHHDRSCSQAEGPQHRAQPFWWRVFKFFASI